MGGIVEGSNSTVAFRNASTAEAGNKGVTERSAVMERGW